MHKVVMELPIVKYADNFTFEDLKKLILDNPIKAWTRSHGQSSLTFIENGQEKAELSFVAGCQGEGFLIQYSNREDINDVLYVTEGEHKNQVLEYTFGGDVYQTFSEYLVSKETLLEAVEYFMETGKRLENLNWKDFEVPETEANTA